VNSDSLSFYRRNLSKYGILPHSLISGDKFAHRSTLTPVFTLFFPKKRRKPRKEDSVTCTITQVNTGVLAGGADNWVTWNALAQQYKNMVGGSETPTIIIYSDRCEGMGLILQKQP
jgi:hypothetical protein